MRCLVTAGPTYEPLDKVRRLTNFSTGRLGGELARFLESQGHRVTLCLGEHATWSGPLAGVNLVRFTTTEDLRARLQAVSGAEAEAVFHAAAVSDFAFGKVWRRGENGEMEELQSGKLSTRSGNLLAELVPTSKLLPKLRDWWPKAFIVGWKYEVDGDRASAVAAAEAQIEEARTNACVVNGPAYGPGFGLLTPDGSLAHAATAAALYTYLDGWIVKPR